MDLDIKPLGVNLSCAEDGPQDEWLPPCNQTTQMTSSMVEVVRIAYMIVITAVLSAWTTKNGVQFCISVQRFSTFIRKFLEKLLKLFGFNIDRGEVSDNYVS